MVQEARGASKQQGKCKFKRGFLGKCTVQLKHLWRIAGRPGDNAANYLRTDWMKHIIDAGHIVRRPTLAPGQITESAAESQSRNARERHETK